MIFGWFFAKAINWIAILVRPVTVFWPFVGASMHRLSMACPGANMLSAFKTQTPNLFTTEKPVLVLKTGDCKASAAAQPSNQHHGGPKAAKAPHGAGRARQAIGCKRLVDSNRLSDVGSVLEPSKNTWLIRFDLDLVLCLVHWCLILTQSWEQGTYIRELYRVRQTWWRHHKSTCWMVLIFYNHAVIFWNCFNRAVSAEWWNFSKTSRDPSTQLAVKMIAPVSFGWNVMYKASAAMRFEHEFIPIVEVERDAQAFGHEPIWIGSSLKKWTFYGTLRK